MDFLKNAADLHANKEMEDAKFKADMIKSHADRAHQHDMQNKQMLADAIKAEHAPKREPKAKKGE